MTHNPHIGSSFDDFLKEQGIYEEVRAVATKRVLAWKISREMEKRGLSKTEMADKMKTSRSSLDRLLNPDNTSVTLKTMDRAASVLGKQLKVELVDKDELTESDRQFSSGYSLPDTDTSALSLV